MKFEINPLQVAERCRLPHQPLNFKSDSDRNAFADQVWMNSQALFSVLERMGLVGSVSGLDTDIDFYMNDDVGLFRMLSLVVKSRKMISRRVIVAISEFLATLHEPYSVLMSCDIDDEIELFIIHITRDEATAQFETPEMAQAFGFDPKSPHIGPIIE